MAKMQSSIFEYEIGQSILKYQDQISQDMMYRDQTVAHIGKRGIRRRDTRPKHYQE